MQYLFSDNSLGFFQNNQRSIWTSDAVSIHVLVCVSSAISVFKTRLMETPQPR